MEYIRILIKDFWKITLMKNKKPRVAIYSPYLDTFGGGEKYMLTIAEILSRTHQVDVLLDSHLYLIGKDYLKKNLTDRFNLELKNVDFVKAPIGKGSNFIERSIFLKKFDILFYLTDGSIFIPTAKKNILHIQSPIIGQPVTSTWGRLKLKGWDLIIYNSDFTKQNSENNWPMKSIVIYPPVDVSKIRPLEKKKYILSVGRFFGYLKDKKHEVMIKAFKNLYSAKKITDWSLNLVGSAAEGDKLYLEELQKTAEGLPVKFYPNLNYKSLIQLYGESSIYWHAAGFGEDDPTKMEHFGISTVEAMAAGCVPIVIGKGGQKEIVNDGIDGYLWNSTDELVKKTLRLMGNQILSKKIRIKAIQKSKQFSSKKFKEKIKKIIED